MKYGPLSWLVLGALVGDPEPVLGTQVIDKMSSLAGTKVEVEYTAAVLEYQPYSSWVSGGLAILQENAHIYLEYAARARDQGADIIVFPEYGLTSTHVAGGDIITLSQLVSDPADHIVPCDFPDYNYTMVMRELSCGARELGMYFVVNLIEQEQCMDTPTNSQAIPTSSTQPKTSQEQLSSHPTIEGKEVQRQAKQCPSSGYILYNAQVVFDRAGAVVARYRKKHLFLEPEFTPGMEDDTSAIFTTDFGVTFTLQICFDIMYKSPGLCNMEADGLRDVAMSTAWIDELPFLTAPQIFSGWSRGQGVNLLVANYHDAPTGKLGSGIFNGGSSLESLYTYDHLGETTLLVGSVLTLGTQCKGHQSMINSITGHNLEFKGGNFKTPKKDIDEVGGSKDPKGVPEKPMKPQSYRGNTTLGDILTRFSDSASWQMKTKNDFFFLHENLDLYNHIVLERSEKNMNFTKTLCYNGSFCCTVTYSYAHKGTKEGLYMLLAYNGLVTKGNGVYVMYIQVCAVVYCLNENITSCASLNDEEVNLTSEETNQTDEKMTLTNGEANLTSEEATLTSEEATLTNEETLVTFWPYELYGVFNTPYVYPSVFTQQLTLANDALWEFSNTGRNEIMNESCSFIDNLPEENVCCISMHDTLALDLLSLTLFGRWYSQDPDVLMTIL
ncbi:vanin-like protein 2 isoform X2 [Procambarus clarkii]|uniref:vanin-like protein 2 isoform X2 n=1 Tax=Procambarus clarkii TaxID=6728 RepID=UPI0037446B3C